MKRILPLFLIGLGILLILGPAGWLYFDGLISRPAAVSLPDEIAGLQITVRRTGAQAAAEFEQLHGKQFPLTSGAIGIYGDNQITVWAAGAPLNFMASQMVDAMREKIAKGNSPFTPMSEFNDNNRIVYVLEGMGQRHYYFQSQNLVIWLAADPAVAETAIQQTLEAFP
ncbi:MAG: hypothetical protein HND47_12105 [Chloroflexi bacterium]|nr:hypothetical protein [Chloroflexota bacterium]